MSRIVNDVSSYQYASKAYFENLKRHGSHGAVVKMTDGVDYLNPKAKYQVYWAWKVFGKVSVYHFLEGNVSAISQARYFRNWLLAFHLDKSTEWALDVESYNLPWNCDYMIDQFINYMKSHGYPNGRVVYGSASWFNEGRINQDALNTSKFWVAAYGGSEPGVNNASVWQYSDNFCGLDTDASLDFNGTFTGVDKPKKSKPKKIIKKPSSHKPVTKYWHKTGKYVVTTSVNLYHDVKLHKTDNVHLDKGSTFDVSQVFTIGGVTRMKTDVGFITGNSKFTRPVK